MKKLALITILFTVACAKGPLKQVEQSRHAGGFFAPFSTGAVLDSQLVTDGENFYFGTKNGKVYSVRSNHRNLWSTKLSSSVDTSVLVGQSKVYVGTGDAKVYALDRASGKTLWSIVLSSPPRGNLTQVGSTILVGTNDGTLMAFDQENGNVLWKYHHEPYEKMKIQFFVQGSVQNNQVFVGFPDGELVALDAATGSESWKKSIQDPTARFYDLSSILLIPGKGILASLVTGPSTMYSFSGQQMWSINDTSTQAAPVLLQDGRILIAAKDKLLWVDADGRQTSSIIYPRPMRPAGVSSNAGQVYVSSFDGALHVFDEKGSQWLWEYEMGISVQGAPIVLKDKIWTLNRRGQLITMKRVP